MWFLFMYFILVHALGSSLRLNTLVFWAKVHADAVDTVPLISGRGIALALEDVSKVSSTIRANNLDPLHTECTVRVSGDGIWDGVKECRPATARLEFVFRSV